MRDHFSIEQFFVPPQHSESNGQIERFHSTLLEIARCLKAQQAIIEITDLVLLATFKYNNSIHSVTNRKPIDILQNYSKESLIGIKNKLLKSQGNSLNRLNKKSSTKIYKPGEIVFVRRNRRLGNKFDKVFVQGTVDKDLGSTVLVDGKKVHKNNLR